MARVTDERYRKMKKSYAFKRMNIERMKTTADENKKKGIKEFSNSSQIADKGVDLFYLCNGKADMVEYLLTLISKGDITFQELVTLINSK